LHTPFWHTSPLVQALLSEHTAVLLLYTHVPVLAVQLSSVQGLLSEQTLGLPPVQTPLWQVSVWVQALLSEQLAPDAGAYTHAPVWVLQLSVVHGLLSLQVTLPVATHAPPWHLSPVVQALPSVHCPPASAVLAQFHRLLIWTQVSAVQTLLSLQSVLAVATVHWQMLPEPTHWPAAHLSVEVQSLPSLQLAALFV